MASDCFACQTTRRLAGCPWRPSLPPPKLVEPGLGSCFANMLQFIHGDVVSALRSQAQGGAPGAAVATRCQYITDRSAWASPPTLMRCSLRNTQKPKMNHARTWPASAPGQVCALGVLMERVGAPRVRIWPQRPLQGGAEMAMIFTMKPLQAASSLVRVDDSRRLLGAPS